MSNPPATLLSQVDIAELLGVNKQRVSVLKRHPDFPAPCSTINRGKGLVWDREDIERYAERRNGKAQ